LAGLRENDIITHLASKEILSAATLIKVLWRHDVGDTVEVVYSRDGKEFTTEVTLEQRPKSDAV